MWPRTVYDVLAVYEGDPSGNVPQGAQDEVQMRLLSCWIMPQATCQRIRDCGITELLSWTTNKIGGEGWCQIFKIKISIILIPRPWYGIVWYISSL